MVESNKVKSLQEHGRQVDERMQVLHQEMQEPIMENKRQWQE
jgi:hypothetical protein